jgi:hypothetical protein
MVFPAPKSGDRAVKRLDIEGTDMNYWDRSGTDIPGPPPANWPTQTELAGRIARQRKIKAKIRGGMGAGRGDNANSQGY